MVGGQGAEAGLAVEGGPGVVEAQVVEEQLLLSVGEAAVVEYHQPGGEVAPGVRWLLAEEARGERWMLVRGAGVERSWLVGAAVLVRRSVVEVGVLLPQGEGAQAVRRCSAVGEVLLLSTADSGVVVNSEGAGEARTQRVLSVAEAAKRQEPGLVKGVEEARGHGSAVAAGRFSDRQKEGVHRTSGPALSVLRRASSAGVAGAAAQARARCWHAQVCQRRGAAGARGISVSMVSFRSERRATRLSSRTVLGQEEVGALRLVAQLGAEGAP